MTRQFIKPCIKNPHSRYDYSLLISNYREQSENQFFSIINLFPLSMWLHSHIQIFCFSDSIFRVNVVVCIANLYKYSVFKTMNKTHKLHLQNVTYN